MLPLLLLLIDTKRFRLCKNHHKTRFVAAVAAEETQWERTDETNNTNTMMRRMACEWRIRKATWRNHKRREIVDLNLYLFAIFLIHFTCARTREGGWGLDGTTEPTDTRV